MNDIVDVKVENRDGRLMVSSLEVAERFGKRHANVLRAIQDLEMSDEFRALNFEFSEYEAPGNSRKYPMAWMTRDGFWALAMPFTGPAAAKLREGIIACLNKAEELMKSAIGTMDIPSLLEMAAKEVRQLQGENEKLIDAAAAERKATLAITQERTKDIDRIRDLERRLKMAKEKSTVLGKHAWKVKGEIEELLAGINNETQDIFSGEDANKVTPIKKKDWQRPL